MHAFFAYAEPTDLSGSGWLLIMICGAILIGICGLRRSPTFGCPDRVLTI